MTLPAAMGEAATRFIDVLDPGQRRAASFEFEDSDRLNWTYVPAPRRGLPIADMDESARGQLSALLGTVMSPSGKATAKAIVAHEVILGALESRGGASSHRRDPGLYYLSLFGDPRGPAPWAWRFEGHHLSLHFTAAAGRVAPTPSFFGANPADVPSGPRRGLRILAPLEDLARSLVTSLAPAQRDRAVIADHAPRDIITTTARRVSLERAEGIPSSALSSAQQAILSDLVGAYSERWDQPLNEDARARVGPVHFAWAGGFVKREPHYYRIQGDTVLIEYDNVQNGANHIHTVWRDSEIDFGLDLLERHHEREHLSPSG